MSQDWTGEGAKNKKAKTSGEIVTKKGPWPKQKPFCNGLGIREIGGNTIRLYSQHFLYDISLLTKI